MKYQKYAKTILSIVLSLMMTLTMLPAFSVSAAASGSITLTAPKAPDSEDTYVDLSGMEVKAYRVLDEENPDGSPGLFTVNADFTDFFSDAEKTFYEGTTYVADGKVNDIPMYFTYKDNKLALSSDKPESGEYIEVQGKDIRDMIASEADHRKYFAAAIMEAILGRRSQELVNNANSKILAEWLRKFAVANGVTPKDGTFIGSDDNKTPDKIEFKDLDLGYWLLVSENAPENVANVETVFRLAQQDGIDEEPTVDAQLKLENQELEKQVKNSEHTAPTSEEYGEKTTAEAGDVLNYKVTTKVPDLRDYDGSRLSAPDDKVNYEYKITDTLHNQWLVDAEDNYVSGDTFGKGVFTITISYKDASAATKTITLKDVESPGAGEKSLKEYLKTPSSTYGSYDTGTKTQTFILDFDVQKLRELEISEAGSWKEAELTLEYNAELTSDAVLVNDNDVSLEYSNDPKTTTPKTITDETKVYSYGIALTKTFESDSSGTINPGDDAYAALAEKVTFRLYSATADEEGNVTKNEPALDVIGNPGDYRIADSEDPTDAGDDLLPTEKTKDLKLGTDGKIKVYGLDEGYYVLEETSAPSGYAKIKEIIIHIVANDNTYQVTSWVKDGDLTLDTTNDNDTVGSSDTNYLKFTAINSRGMSLPDTGGAGVWLLLIGGVALITLAAAMVISHRKHRAE